MHRNSQYSTFGEIFNSIFEIPIRIGYQFGGASAKIYTCFERKTTFVMHNLQYIGAIGGWGDHFSAKPPKGTSSADFTRFESLCVRIGSGFFPAGVTTKKMTLQNVTQRLYFTYLRGIPTQPNLTKIDIWVGVAEIINPTKFGNDRLGEYKVTEGQILACSIEIACRL